MNNLIEKYDEWLLNDGPAALVVREYLIPVEGKDGVVFPSTFAASEDKTFKGGYNIDTFTDGKNVCLIDSPGSQANRSEPIFARGEYAGLVPQIVVSAGKKKVNLLEAGHRAADAIVRNSELQQELRDAFLQVQNGNASSLAKIAPTSIVFGAWDSRDTQAKLPRLFASTIRAFDVRKLTRSAQYVPAVEYVADGLLDDASDNKTLKEAYSQFGFVHVPASATHGGVIATGDIRRDAALHLAALRLLNMGEDQQSRLPLLRYVFGLALTALTHPAAGYLRQGCNLVQDPEKPREFTLVYSDGRREPATVTHAEALEYAKAAASAFGVGANRDVQFDIAKAKAEVSGDAGKKGKKATKAEKGS